MACPECRQRPRYLRNVLSRRSCHCVPVSRLVVGDELIGLIGKNADEVGLGTRGISIEKRAPAQRFCFIVSGVSRVIWGTRESRPCSKGMATLIARRPAGGFPCPAAPTRGQTYECLLRPSIVGEQRPVGTPYSSPPRGLFSSTQSMIQPFSERAADLILSISSTMSLSLPETKISSGIPT
jgi:hypothetical protein